MAGESRWPSLADTQMLQPRVELMTVARGRSSAQLGPQSHFGGFPSAPNMAKGPKKRSPTSSGGLAIYSS